MANPDQPVEISEQGFYRTRMQAVPAQYRYPWSLAEIASAARLLGYLHAVLRQITFDPQAACPATEEQWLHLDFARGNVLSSGAGRSPPFMRGMRAPFLFLGQGQRGNT